MQNEVDAHRNIERNIVKEVMRECFPKKIFPNENFVAYFIKLLLLDPNWQITDDFLTSRENVAKFVTFVISELEGKNDPKIITLQMQFYFTCNLENMNNAVKRHREEMLERLTRLKNEIFRINETDSQDQVENLTKMIIYYIVLVSGLGNPLDAEVYDEALAAFRSMMDDEEVKEFMALPLHEKDLNINHIICIVSGIRLFNKETEMGGAGIQDLPALLDKAILSIKEEVHTILKNIMDKVNRLTSVVDKCYVLEKEGVDFKMLLKLPNDMEDVIIENIKDLLIFYRQCELFIRKVIEHIEKIEEYSNDIYEIFQNILRELYQMVNVKIAIPARLVFPLFESMYLTWTDLQNQVVLLARYSRIVVNLVGYTNSVNYNKELMDFLLENTGPMTDAERLQETANLNIDSVTEKVEISKVEDFPNIDDIQLQYLGFCSWKLVKTKGGLIPGNPKMGIATYNKKHFAFSVPQAGTEFSVKPNELVNEVLHLGRKKPHLINFLLIKEQLEEAMHIEQLAKEKRYVTLTQDKLTQCEDHFEDHKIDRNYYWNVWDLKRQALQLANLSKRKTVSTQTFKSHFINTVNTQTYEKRDKEVQTRKDNYSNVPTPSNFIYGLRGRKDDKQFIINLTRPVSNY